MRGAWCCIRDGCTSMSRGGNERGALMDLGQERPQVPAKARNVSPIIPRGSIAGRAGAPGIQRENKKAEGQDRGREVEPRAGGGVAVRAE